MGNVLCVHSGNSAGSCFVSGPQSRSIRGGFFGCAYSRPRSRAHRSCTRARGSQSRRISFYATVPVLEIAPMCIHLAKSKSGSALPLPRKLTSAPAATIFHSRVYLLLQRKLRSVLTLLSAHAHSF